MGPHRTAPGTPEGLRIGGLRVLGARTYDPVTRLFLPPDPLATVPATNGAASAYTYAWQDPINYIDPTGMQPVSIEAYDAIRQREEQGRLGKPGKQSKTTPGEPSPQLRWLPSAAGSCSCPAARSSGPAS